MGPKKPVSHPCSALAEASAQFSVEVIKYSDSEGQVQMVSSLDLL